MMYAIGEEKAEESETDSAEPRNTAQEAEILNLMNHIAQHYPEDEVLQRIIVPERAGAWRIPMDLFRKKGIRLELTSCEFHEKKEFLHVNRRIYVPMGARTEALRQVHSSPVSGHCRRAETYDQLHRNYFWPEMTASTGNKTC
jgi:hypothetical protein